MFSLKSKKTSLSWWRKYTLDLLKKFKLSLHICELDILIVYESPSLSSDLHHVRLKLFVEREFSWVSNPEAYTSFPCIAYEGSPSFSGSWQCRLVQWPCEQRDWKLTELLFVVYMSAIRWVFLHLWKFGRSSTSNLSYTKCEKLLFKIFQLLRKLLLILRA